MINFRPFVRHSCPDHRVWYLLVIAVSEQQQRQRKKVENFSSHKNLTPEQTPSIIVQNMRGFSFLFVVFQICSAAAMPLPFTRELTVTSPMQQGNDVIIAQQLLNREQAVSPLLNVDGIFGNDCARATKQFQAVVGLKETGTIDTVTAQKLLDLHSADGIKDTGFTAASMGYLYKLYIPVHNNRSVETTARLFDKNNNELLSFRVRTHGYRNDGLHASWPDFGNGDIGLTQLYSNGDTMTGLFEIDLNSPEPDPTSYGPYPVNRFVRGLDGNAQFLLPNIRDGILLHTGNWTTSSKTWDSSMDMPNSSGCIHAHPEDIEAVYKLLVSNGVVVNNNPFSGKNYPFKPQGIAVIELID